MRTTISEQVIAFHAAGDIPILSEPSIPPDERVRLRARLITEEYFELMESIFGEMPVFKNQISKLIAYNPIDINLPDFADATCDLDYVVEGSRLEFGIDGYPIAKAIHEANMKKLKGDIDKRLDGKILKPEGWKPADIGKLLEEQGWKRTTA